MFLCVCSYVYLCTYIEIHMVCMMSRVVELNHPAELAYAPAIDGGPILLTAPTRTNTVGILSRHLVLLLLESLLVLRALT